MAKEYTTLLDTYKRLFSMVDTFHFNSQNTAEVYGHYLDIPTTSKVVSITHDGILDHRKRRVYDEKLLRLGFIGSEAPYKGLSMLKEVIAQLNQEGYVDKITLHVFGGRIGQDEHLSNVVFKGRFTQRMMEQVFDDMDLLVIPSIWHETFSLVALEALSYGTCVLVSDKVGAKDIVSRYSPEFVFKPKQRLHDIIMELLVNRDRVSQYNKAIVSSSWAW